MVQTFINIHFGEPLTFHQASSSEYLSPSAVDPPGVVREEPTGAAHTCEIWQDPQIIIWHHHGTVIGDGQVLVLI